MKTPMEEVNDFLLPGETVLMTSRQSYLSSVSPDRIYVTDKRLILIHHSFWGLYFGHNIFDATRVDMVKYDSVKGVIITKGKILSSLKIRSRIGTETAEPSSEWGIDGIRHHEAEIMLNLVQDLVENRGAVRIESFGLEEAKEVVDAEHTRFLWLGVQDYQAALGVMQVRREKIGQLLPSEIDRLSKAQVEALKGCILVDYNGSLSASVAKYLKKEYNVETFTLKGGLYAVRHGPNSTPDLIKALQEDAMRTDNWVAKNASLIGRIVEIVFGLVWYADAMLKLNSNFSANVSSLIAQGARGQPYAIQQWIGFWTGLSALNPQAFASIVMGIELIIAVSLVFGLFRKPIYGIGFMYSILIWSIPEGFGGPYNLATSPIWPTEIGTGIIYAFVFALAALINATYGSSKYTLDNLIERHVPRWESIAEIKH